MTRILVVDDMEENRYLLRALLQGHGYDVDEARHGAEALVRARQTPPLLIISDLLMPVMDGYTLLRHWKADERLNPIPFVVYTATYTEPRDEKLALELGADAFIIKPAEPEVFLTRVREILAKAATGELASTLPDASGEKALLREYNEVLVRKLEQKTLELEQANRELQADIAARQQVAESLRQQTDELCARNLELTRFNRVAVGRELRMIELKQEVNTLCRRLGEPLHHAALPTGVG